MAGLVAHVVLTSEPRNSMASFRLSDGYISRLLRCLEAGGTAGCFSLRVKAVFDYISLAGRWADLHLRNAGDSDTALLGTDSISVELDDASGDKVRSRIFQNCHRENYIPGPTDGFRIFGHAISRHPGMKI